MKALTPTLLVFVPLLVAGVAYLAVERGGQAKETMDSPAERAPLATTPDTPEIDASAGLPSEAASEAWMEVWAQVRADQKFGGYLPQAAREAGPPLFDASRVLFRFDAPPGTESVYLAGNFNQWAQNSEGRVRNERFAMESGPGGIWFKEIDLPAGRVRYRYIAEDASGRQRWIADPHVRDRDGDGNSVAENPIRRNAASQTNHPVLPPAGERAPLPAIELRAAKVRALPDESQKVWVTLPEHSNPAQAELLLRVSTPVGEVLHEANFTVGSFEGSVMIPGISQEGGYRVALELRREGEILAAGQTVISVVRDLGDDLRYGFYATYEDDDGDYAGKAALLAEAHINAVEYYDYFPAHGKYAPTEAVYTFEPFSTRINAVDVQRKIEAGHDRGILSLAYVAAYAASREIYRQYPFPMTDRDGEPKIFNGSIMPESEAEARGLPKWFWLMDVSRGSQWHDFIMGEFARTLDESDGDLVSFDGFEIDTYGDEVGARFYAQGSSRNGDLLSEVLKNFVRDVQALTQRIKPLGLVSFNSVNEFGVEQMYDATDFLFLEIWRDYTDRIADLVDICYYHRSIAQQRVILKLYPVDMEPSFERWPPDVLARVLGATMTGGGSLMVAGEPDEVSGRLHGLQSLYYPDHLAMSLESEAVLRSYYRLDALLYGYTHGPEVANTRFNVSAPGCLLRTFAAPGKQALVVQLLNPGNEHRWSREPRSTKAEEGIPLTIDLPGGVAPERVFFASPDAADFHDPVELDFDVADGRLSSSIPQVQFHATVIVHY